MVPSTGSLKDAQAYWESLSYSPKLALNTKGFRDEAKADQRTYEVIVPCTFTGGVGHTLVGRACCTASEVGLGPKGTCINAPTRSMHYEELDMYDATLGVSAREVGTAFGAKSSELTRMNSI